MYMLPGALRYVFFEPAAAYIRDTGLGPATGNEG
jgi:hypothetical protein